MTHRARHLTFFWALALALCLAGPLHAQIPSSNQGRAEGAEPMKPMESAEVVEMEERSSSRQGRVTIAGMPVAYTATVGDIVLRDDDGEPRAKMTYVSYLRNGVDDPTRRPVTFAFNGGPGAASVWVHLGVFGPKRAELDDEGFPLGPPPGRLIDNEHSLLDRTDLVMIDPVETGFSRPAPGVETTEFTGFTNDVASVGEFIRLWLSRNGRWASPKFIAGESYGTTRAAGLAEYLQQEHGMYLNGVVLISSVINWQTKVFNIGNDLPYALILPTYTAAAWYHGKLPERFDGDLQAALAESEAFALGEYTTALMQGDELPPEERARIAGRLSELSGLSVEYLEDADLRVHIFRFVKELLRDGTRPWAAGRGRLPRERRRDGRWADARWQSHGRRRRGDDLRSRPRLPLRRGDQRDRAGRWRQRDLRCRGPGGACRPVDRIGRRRAHPGTAIRRERTPQCDRR
jgi:carboxypeptidase C (cathepsin A)